MSTAIQYDALNPATYEQAFSAFEAAFSGVRLVPDAAAVTETTAAPGASALDPCAQWKQSRQTVNGVIAALHGVGGLFPIAERAAKVIETLAGVIDQICG